MPDTPFPPAARYRNYLRKGIAGTFKPFLGQCCMAKKSWIDKAAESGDWSGATKQAGKMLAKAATEIRNSRQPRDREKVTCFGEGEEREVAPDLNPDDRVEELVEDENDDELPTDAEERALGQPETAPTVTLSAAYDDYLARGGNRRLPKRVLALLGTTNVNQIDRSTIIAAGRELYPSLSQAQRGELVHHPIEEVLGGVRSAERVAAKRHRELDAKYQGERDRARLARYHAEKAKYQEAWFAHLRGDDKLYRELGLPVGNRISDHEFWANVAMRDPAWWRANWAGVSNFKPPGPPPDPVESKSAWRPSTHYERWTYKHRNLLSALKRPDGTELKFGYPPTKNSMPRVEDGTYYSYEPGKPGRPPRTDKLSNAAKQKAYRDRLRAKKSK
jgi:hypothetical protein